MLEKYFSAPKTLTRLRTGISAPHIDGFADALKQDGYSSASAVRYLRAAAHLGHFLETKRVGLADIDARRLNAFRRHIPRCRCRLSNGGKVNHHVFFGAKRFHVYLFEKGICQHGPTLQVAQIPEPTLIVSFRDWFQRHRGAADATLRQYCRGASHMLSTLGEDVSRWSAQHIRTFLLDRVKQCGEHTAEKLVTSMRAFLRYLSFRGLCSVELNGAVPSLAHWRLARLPESLNSEEVDRLIAACDGHRWLRDRAIIFLLVRLGLRAGDVAHLRLDDIEWESGTLRVMGKGRYEVRLPLPQDAGDALLQYLESRPNLDTDRVFLRRIAPFRPAISNDCVAGVVNRALRRAGVTSAAKGAHLLRHTAATEMLRHGVPLDQIGLVLRHRGIDTTAH